MDFNSNSDDNQASSTSNHRKRPGRPKKHVKDDEKRAANNERDANYRKKKKIEESEKRVQQKEAKEMNDKLELEYSGMLTKHTSMFKEYLKILRSINLPPDPKFNWNEPVPLPGNKTDFTGVEKNITDYKHELITSEKNYSLKIEEHKQQPYVNASKKFHVKKDITATYESEIFGIRKNINELYKTLIKGICDINQNLEEEIKQLKNVNIESFAEDKSIYDFILPSNESQMLFNNAQEPYYDYSSNHPIHPPPTNFQFPISGGANNQNELMENVHQREPLQQRDDSMLNQIVPDESLNNGYYAAPVENPNNFSHENPAPQIYEQLFDTTTTLLQSNQSESKLQDFNYGATSNSCRNGHHQNPHPEYQPNVQLANDGGTVNRKNYQSNQLESELECLNVDYSTNFQSYAHHQHPAPEFPPPIPVAPVNWSTDSNNQQYIAPQQQQNNNFGVSSNSNKLTRFRTYENENEGESGIIKIVNEDGHPILFELSNEDIPFVKKKWVQPNDFFEHTFDLDEGMVWICNAWFNGVTGNKPIPFNAWEGKNVKFMIRNRGIYKADLDGKNEKIHVKFI